MLPIWGTGWHPSQAISRYRNLWQIERAFRMSKTDLKQRPVYHRLRQRIQSHLLICFCSLPVMKQAETMPAELKKLDTIKKK